MEFIDEKTVNLDKELNSLDEFVLDFVTVMKRHVKYVIVSGYSVILFGRSRATEDVDSCIEKISGEKFKAFYNDLLESGYWFLTTGNVDELYKELGIEHVRIALKNEVLPNIEMKMPKNEIDEKSLEGAMTIQLSRGDIQIGPVEIQIPYKEEILKSPKDMEDARHLRDIFKEHINEEKLDEYRALLKRMWDENKI